MTVLGASLSDILSEPSDSDWKAWLSAFGADDPILKDRGYGYALLADEDGSISYPIYAIVAPDMTVITIDGGYSTGTWDEIANIIRDHADGG